MTQPIRQGYISKFLRNVLEIIYRRVAMTFCILESRTFLNDRLDLDACDSESFVSLKESSNNNRIILPLTLTRPTDGDPPGRDRTPLSVTPNLLYGLRPHEPRLHLH